MRERRDTSLHGRMVRRLVDDLIEETRRAGCAIDIDDLRRCFYAARDRRLDLDPKGIELDEASMDGPHGFAVRPSLIKREV